MCKNEIAGEEQDVIFSAQDDFIRKEPSRDCRILHGENHQQKTEIEKIAKELGVPPLGKRCPFYGNKTCQTDCPCFI